MKLSEEIKKYLNDVKIDTDDNYETIKYEWLPKITQLEKDKKQLSEVIEKYID